MARPENPVGSQDEDDDATDAPAASCSECDDRRFCGMCPRTRQYRDEQAAELDGLDF